jgi:hypothetical protein
MSDDRMLILRGGKVLAAGTPEGLQGLMGRK